MTFDLDKIKQSKIALRKKLAKLPIAEKLRMLDAMREAALTLRPPTKSQDPAKVARNKKYEE